MLRPQKATAPPYSSKTIEADDSMSFSSPVIIASIASAPSCDSMNARSPSTRESSTLHSTIFSPEIGLSTMIFLSMKSLAISTSLMKFSTDTCATSTASGLVPSPLGFFFGSRILVLRFAIALKRFSSGSFIASSTASTSGLAIVARMIAIESTSASGNKYFSSSRRKPSPPLPAFSALRPEAEVASSLTERRRSASRNSAQSRALSERAGPLPTVLAASLSSLDARSHRRCASLISPIETGTAPALHIETHSRWLMLKLSAPPLPAVPGAALFLQYSKKSATIFIRLR